VKNNILLAVLILVSFSSGLLAQGKTFVISSPKTTAQLVLDDKEILLVHTAAALFADDVNRISGRRPEIKSSGNTQFLIKVGTLGVNKSFDIECKKAGIDTDKLKAKWEAYVIKVSPKKNILYVAGSNPRGTAFGLMELSQRIGVSPWYWWADVTPVKKDVIELPGDISVEDAPQVKFRGIFLNDEDWGLKPWASKTFEPETGDIGPKTYEKIFELLLRLKANSIWPAMHDCTRAFFTYPGNIQMADKYGIWVGSSHCEPMLRNNVDEWHRWNPSQGKRGAWNFDENPDQIKEYWKQRVDTTAKYDGIYTVGMRGIHDGDMPGGKDLNDKVRILNNVFDAQRNILHEVTGKDVTTIPQIFCPYKEVLNIYQAGAKVPDDVTIMWADDNNGYIRQLSNESERKRSGGAGVYYHISYWGRPHDYLWLESVPVALIWEEMHKAFETNAKNVWIVNVGDIKSNEIGMNFFLDMAWNPNRYSPETIDSYYAHFAASQFGTQYSKEIGDILKQYFQLGFSRKPEHMGWNGVYPNSPVHDPELSLFNYGDEVQKRIDAYNKLEKQSEALYNTLPAHLKDAYFQLVNHKVLGASNMNKKILYAYKSRVYAEQRRNSSNEYASLAQRAFEKIKEITLEYNSLSGGKWENMMAYNPRQLPVFDMPPTGSYNPAENASGGILPEGYDSAIDGNLVLPVFNPSIDRSYFVDIYNTGKEPLKWEAEVNDSRIKLSKASGETNTEERVWVSIDRTKSYIDSDTFKSTINFKLNGILHPVNVLVKDTKPENYRKPIFIENNGIVAIEAEHYTAIKSFNYNWQIINGLGREGNAIGSFPVSAEPIKTDDLSKAAELSYDFYTSSSGKVKMRFFYIPTLPINNNYQLRFAVSIDDASPVIINANLKEAMDENNQEWKNNVLRSVTIQESEAVLKKDGIHSLKIQMIDPGVVIDKIEIVTGQEKDSYFGAEETLINK
jgi:hypothetical protein